MGPHAGTGVVTYRDTTAAVPGPTYYYRVNASNVVGDTVTPGFPTITHNSAFSNTVTAVSWGSGQTTPGATNWKANGPNSITLNVNTAAAGFTATPLYFTSLGGTSNQRNAQGITAINSPTSTGFSLVVSLVSGGALTPAYANSNGWYVQWLGVPTTATNAGSTGTASWQANGPNSIFVDVNTAAAGFASTPIYFTSVGGTSNHRNAQGVNAIYSATKTGFRVYLRRWDGAALTPAYANSNGWKIQWLGVPTTATNAGSTGVGWQANGGTSITLNVNTGTAGFTGKPLYFTSLGGNSNMFDAEGVAAIYSATPTGFGVVLKNWNNAALTPANAISNGWKMQWLGVV